MNETDLLAKKIWNYMLLHQELVPSDAIFLLGSNDIRLADYTAELFFKSLAPIIICSGGIAHQNDVNNPGWGRAEAEVYKERLIDLGVPEKIILIETEAQSTGDNVVNIRKLLGRENLNINSAIIIQKPFMERRAYATFKKQWSELNIIVSSPDISYEDFMNSGEISKDVFINVMVGDLQRIKLYPEKGFQIEQEIPEDVWESGQKLISLGFNKYLPE